MPAPGPEPAAPALEVAATPLTGVRAIDVDGAMSCAVLDSGRVACWGMIVDSNASGRGAPWVREVPGLSDVRQVAVGWWHVCALLGSGRVACWGQNRDGQLGDGTTVFRAEPVEVANVAHVVHVDVGMARSCAVLRSGEVVCWGGSLPDPPAAPPTAVQGLSDAVAVSVGMQHACALRAGGRVSCWGANQCGELGAPGSSPGPIEVPDLRDAVAVSVGGPEPCFDGTQGAPCGAHSCALLASGDVLCWGSSRVGALGLGADRLGPVGPRLVLRQAVSIAAGQAHVCAATQDGLAYCWGDNSRGQLGNGRRGAAAVPHQVVGLADAVEVASSRVGGCDYGAGARPRCESHSCARLRSGEVACWGSNQSGALAYPTGEMSAVARTVPLRPPP